VAYKTILMFLTHGRKHSCKNIRKIIYQNSTNARADKIVLLARLAIAMQRKQAMGDWAEIWCAKWPNGP
jgi:hypothetical protein